MANFEKPKSSFFGRSLTIHPSSKKQSPIHPSLDRAGSVKKLYKDSCESVLSASSSFKGKVKHLCNLFESTKSQSSDESQLQSSAAKVKSLKYISSSLRIISNSNIPRSIRLPGTEDRIVVYLTSLRGIRRTYEDCYAVRMIFRGFRLWIDERDISMDSAYKKELQSVLGEKNYSLPQVFIRGKYIGGADVIKHMFEVGELTKLLDGFPVRKPGFVCESCGDMRFVPCTNCSGSRKVFDEDEDKQKRCFECNENGLIRCRDCCL